jgi:integrase
MSKPKPRHPGQLIRRPNGWLVRVYQGCDASGRRLYLNRTIKGNKKTAQKVLDDLREAVSGGSATVRPTRLSVDELLDKWLELHAKDNCRERTYDGYVFVLNRYIKPKLGRFPATLLSHADIEANYAQLRHKLDVSARTCRAANALLSAAYNWAIEKNLLATNPCSRATLPALPKGKKRRALSQEALSRFLEAARPDRWSVIFNLAFESGLRPEEYLGLTWSDTNLDTGAVSVVRTLVWRKGGEWYFSTPKTERSDRTVVVSETMRLALLDHRRKQLEERLKAGVNYKDNGFVFAMEDGRPVLLRTLDRAHFKPILKRAGLPATTRIYDLRHSCASMLIAAGESHAVVAARLGHQDPAFTLRIYVDTTAEQQKVASEKLAKILAG